jgi:DNA-binding CsgD family transcriptional regulator
LDECRGAGYASDGTSGSGAAHPSIEAFGLPGGSSIAPLVHVAPGRRLQLPYPDGVKKAVLVYGICGGLLIACLKLVEYRFLVVAHSIEIYGGVVALVFAALGIRLGLTLTKTREVVVVREVPVPIPAPGPFSRNDTKVSELGLTPRELEILQQIASGLSTRQIAERLFVSENTVKTHSSRLYEKLGVNRRTQAAHVARTLGLIP